MGPLYSFLSGDSGCWSLDNETCQQSKLHVVFIILFILYQLRRLSSPR